MQTLAPKWRGRDSPGRTGDWVGARPLASREDGTPPGAWLEVRRQGLILQRPIRTAEFLIGRAGHCHLVLDSEPRYVSDEHAVITCSNGLYWISDLSAHGTWLNGKRLLRLGRERLKPGDIIQIGDWELVFHVSLGRAADVQ